MAWALEKRLPTVGTILRFLREKLPTVGTIFGKG